MDEFLSPEDISPEFARSALLTIDLQQDFLDVPGTREVLPVVRRLVRAFRDAGRPVVHVVRLYLPDGSNADLCRRGKIAAGLRAAVPGTAGAQLAGELAPVSVLDTDLLLSGRLQEIGPGEHVLYKPRWSAFHRTRLLEHLTERNVTTVVVAGNNYPNCPRATIVDASERDLRVVAVRDAISRWSTEAGGELAGMGIVPLPAEAVLGGLSAPVS